MPNTEEMVQDTQADGLTPPIDETASSAPSSEDTASTRLILGKYKSIEELEKGEAEKAKLFGRQAEELGRLRAEMENLRQQANLTEVLKTIAESKKEPESQPMDIEAFTETLENDWSVNPRVAAKKLLGVANTWVSQAEGKSKSELEQMKREIEKLKGEMSEKLERLSPEYQQHKDVIDKMVAKGIPLSTARELVKELAGDASPVIAAQRVTPPASVMPTRTISNQVKPQSEYLLDPRKDLEILAREFPELDEKALMDMMTRMNAERQARINEGQPTVQKSYKQMQRRTY